MEGKGLAGGTTDPSPQPSIDPKTGFQPNPGRKLGDTKDQPTPEAIKRQRVARMGRVLRSSRRKASAIKGGKVIGKSLITRGGLGRTALSQAFVPREVRDTEVYAAAQRDYEGAPKAKQVAKQTVQHYKNWAERRKAAQAKAQASGQTGERMAASRVYDRIGDLLGETGRQVPGSPIAPATKKEKAVDAKIRATPEGQANIAAGSARAEKVIQSIRRGV